MKKVYLDNAATTQLDEDVLLAMQEALGNYYGNPSSTHSFGKAAKTLVEKARKKIAGLIGADASEIIFTSGGTEANNMVLRSAVRDLKVTTVITTAIEHHAVFNTVLQLQKEYAIKVAFVQVQANGLVDLDHLKALLEQHAAEKVLVSLMHVNNETGIILPLESVGNLCKSHGVLFHSDTVQSIHHLPCKLSELPVDFITASAHKFHGPKGIGFVYIKRDSGIRALLFGGEQERGVRAGTEAVHNIIGLEIAFAKAISLMDVTEAHLLEIKTYFMQLLTTNFPEVVFNGGSDDVHKSVSSILNVRFPFNAEKGKLLLFHLDLLGGIACSAGSACQSGSNKPSHVLSEILTNEELSKPSVRFSFSKYTTKEDIDHTIKILVDFAKK
ncbi:cysteine desulfurase family protein [Neptunitalea lumnitzerae]|uniref:cysteine desulfurase n=1 Tax=Neptunitalea lumnitzerae TaxID=2965509 RepID=A0ABQ5MHP0_9FLAO|nr:cysteine desulfurase family protein [Neptunitalea sp. Y10]GLB48936.1 cysteine desulfurase [Neptunitalea sp. Y10]